MVYLDYSATTPINEEVLESFRKSCQNYIGNPNSLHKLGFEAKKIIDTATYQVANLLKVYPEEIIYTSGASESNNLAIKGIALKYQNRGRHIITTNLEHSSIYGPLSFLQEQGFEVDFVELDKNGMVNLGHLKSLLRDDTILVSVASVNSEIGLRQPIEKIGLLLKQYPKCLFHVDITQSIGKVDVDLTNVNLASFSTHKFYGMKGFGILVKKRNISLEPLIHGGKSTTEYRSGTPALPLIVSGARALRLALTDMDKKYTYVEMLNKYLKEQLKETMGITINSNDECIPHIVNISLFKIKPETMLHALEEYDIYISTQSACSSSHKSRAVYALTKDEDSSLHSMRISLSHLTTKEEIDTFIKVFRKCLGNLILK